MKTVTYDENEWQLVPKVKDDGSLPAGMAVAGALKIAANHNVCEIYRAMLAAAPKEPTT